MGGLDLTLKLLSSTANDAATDVLVAALDAADRDIQEAALKALLDRRSPAGHLALLRRWESMSQRWHSIICERPGRLANTLRSAIVDLDPAVRTAALQAAVAMREYDLMPTLIAVAEQADDRLSHRTSHDEPAGEEPPGDERAEMAGRALLELADLLYDELSNPRNYRQRRDPQLVHQQVANALEQSLGRFHQHKSAHLVESFVLLAKSDNQTLRKLLEDPRHPAYPILLPVLLTSPRPGVMNKIVRFLDKNGAPPSIIEALSQRRDVPFLRRVAKLLDDNLSDATMRNLRRVTQLDWLDDLHIMQALSDAQQAVMMRVAVLSNCPREAVLRLIGYLLERGTVGGRRVAAEVLAEFSGPQADEIAIAALEDPDPLVQAAIARQLRQRGIHGAMMQLIGLLYSPYEPVQQAARESLAEFNFQRYLAAFDMLEPEVRFTTGALVRRIDNQTVQQLATELASPSRIRRMRALQVAPVMNAVEELEEPVIALLSDEDHFIRAEAARALGYANSPEAHRALRAALLDRANTVKEAAEAALQKLSKATSVRAAIEVDPSVVASVLSLTPMPSMEEPAS